MSTDLDKLDFKANDYERKTEIENQTAKIASHPISLLELEVVRFLFLRFATLFGLGCFALLLRSLLGNQI